MAKKNESNDKHYTCSLCDKSYKTEKGLVNHKCKIRPKLQEMKTPYAVIAYNAFKVFYKKIQPTAKEKTHLDFAKSTYYDGFIKFGRYVTDLKIPNYMEYMNYLITYNVKLEDWCRDKVYNVYVKQKTKKEHPQRAIEVTFDTMIRWSKKNNSSWKRYFAEEDKYKVLQCVRTGKISPWVLYNTDTGKVFLTTLTEQDLNIVYDLVDPGFWSTKFLREKSSVESITEILKNAGL